MISIFLVSLLLKCDPKPPEGRASGSLRVHTQETTFSVYFLLGKEAIEGSLEVQAMLY